MHGPTLSHPDGASRLALPARLAAVVVVVLMLPSCGPEKSRVLPTTAETSATAPSAATDETPSDQPQGQGTLPEVPAAVEPSAPTSERPYVQMLINWCAEGQMAACWEVELWGSNPEIQAWAKTCGGHVPEGTGDSRCQDHPSPIPNYGARGTDAYLDVLAQRCEEGRMTSCDQLWAESPEGSEYDALTQDCGGFGIGDREWCNGQSPEETWTYYGTEPERTALWDACAGGDMAACDELKSKGPLRSDYWDFGRSCGGYLPLDFPLLTCAEELVVG